MVRIKNQKPLQISTGHSGAGAGTGAKKSPILLKKMCPQKRLRRWKSGTVALREITKEQKSTKFAIPPASFRREFRKAAESVWKGFGNIRAQEAAAVALQHAAEDYVTDIFKLANRLTIMRDQVTIDKEAFTMAAKIVGGGYKE